MDPQSLLNLDPDAECKKIEALVRTTLRQLRRRGLVVAISGGIDSAVCAALAARAVGAERVLGLMLPERESSPSSLELGREVAAQLGIEHRVVDITRTLESIGCYAERDEAVRRLNPAFGPGYKQKLVLRGGLSGQLNHFVLVTESPDGDVEERRLDLQSYLQLVAATNYKQRVRKTIEYFHADRNNYAVVGTPNRLEYDQGFFVRNGDGSADIKPIAHLFKTQVYALGKYLGLPAQVIESVPTTDTYTLSQGQDEFYFALPYAQMDVALLAYDSGMTAEQLARVLDMPVDKARHVYTDIEAKRRVAATLHASPASLL